MTKIELSFLHGTVHGLLTVLSAFALFKWFGFTEKEAGIFAISGIISGCFAYWRGLTDAPEPRK